MRQVRLLRNVRYGIKNLTLHKLRSLLLRAFVECEYGGKFIAGTN